MKILFLGTGAADWPREKPEDASEFRRLSSALIDGVLLIDPGPGVIDALREYRIDAGQIRYVINTHRHGDHFCAESLKLLEAWGASFVDFAEGEYKEVGGYGILALGGNHGTCEGTLHFMIAREGKSLYYALDGAWLLYREIAAIKEYRPDLAVLDATIGEIDGDYRIFEHNNLNMVLEMKKSLSDDVGTFCISHMARTLHTDHRTLSSKMKAHQIITAYDGLELML